LVGFVVGGLLGAMCGGGGVGSVGGGVGGGGVFFLGVFWSVFVSGAFLGGGFVDKLPWFYLLFFWVLGCVVFGGGWGGGGIFVCVLMIWAAERLCPFRSLDRIMALLPSSTFFLFLKPFFSFSIFFGGESFLSSWT